MKFRKKTETFIAATFVVLTFLYIAALSGDLFFYIWWYDIPLHFLGGLWIGLLAVYLYYYSGFFKSILTENRLFFTMLISVIVVGALWEIFEYYTGLAFTVGNYTLDTVKDMFMDVLGGIVSYIYFTDYFKELPHE